MKEETVGWIWTIFCGFLILWILISPGATYDIPFSEKSFAIFMCVALYFLGGMMILAVYKSFGSGGGGPDWGRDDGDDIGGE